MSSLVVELVANPREQPRVGIADLLDLAQRRLDPRDTPGKASVLLPEIVDAWLGVDGGLVRHVPRSSVVKVSLK